MSKDVTIRIQLCPWQSCYQGSLLLLEVQAISRGKMPKIAKFNELSKMSIFGNPLFKVNSYQKFISRRIDATMFSLANNSLFRWITAENGHFS